MCTFSAHRFLTPEEIKERLMEAIANIHGLANREGLDIILKITPGQAEVLGASPLTSPYGLIQTVVTE